MDGPTIRDRLPDYVAGRLDARQTTDVERALSADPDLVEEAHLLRALADGRPPVPPGLAGRIGRAVREDRSARGAVLGWSGGRSPRFAWTLPPWGFAAAAVAVLALGTTLALDGRRSAQTGPSLPAVAGAATWMTEDVVVAGAPVLEGLSDEMLASLLEELGG